MAEVDDFLAAVMPRLKEAEIALHNGDAGPRMSMWSHHDPVTLFGAARSSSGWEETSAVFEGLAQRFSDCQAYEVEIVAAGASGDLAYLVAYEHTTASVAGSEPTPYVLRATTVFRREDGEWKVVHRHGDPAQDSESAPRLAAQMKEGLKD